VHGGVGVSVPIYHGGALQAHLALGGSFDASPAMTPLP